MWKLYFPTYNKKICIRAHGAHISYLLGLCQKSNQPYCKKKGLVTVCVTRRTTIKIVHYVSIAKSSSWVIWKIKKNLLARRSTFWTWLSDTLRLTNDSCFTQRRFDHKCNIFLTSRRELPTTSWIPKQNFYITVMLVRIMAFYIILVSARVSKCWDHFTWAL